MAAWVAPAIAAASALGSAGIQAATQKGASSNAWQIPIQTQHDFDMFNLQQNYNWDMYNAQVQTERDQYARNFADQYNMSQTAEQWKRDWESTVGQNSIAWRVADAKRAGISPLVALGAPTFNPAPVNIAGMAQPSVPMGGTPMGSSSAIGASGDGGTNNSWIGQLGANIGDIAMKALTPEDQRAIARDQISWDQATKSKDLDIAIKQATLRNIQAGGKGANPDAGTNPIDGQNPALGRMSVEPAKVTAALPGADNVVAGVYGEVQLNKTNTGISPVPSKQSGIQDQQLDNPLFAQWMSRNQIATGFTPPFSSKLYFPGSDGWRWSAAAWEWRPVYPDGSYIHGKFVPRGHYPHGGERGSVTGGTMMP